MENSLNVIFFDTNLISRYRTQLMGWGMLDVLIWHLCSSFGFTGIIAQFFGTITRFVFTPGFLLLSGFGLYYSFSKDSKLTSFYKRRFVRMIIPFSLMVAAVLIVQNIVLQEWDWAYFFGYVTSIGYWIPTIGRHGCWYIALSLVLYFFYPFIHKFLFYTTKNVLFRTLFLISLCWCGNIIMREVFPLYYDRVSLSIPKIPIFVIGIYLGYLAKDEKRINLMSLVISVTLFCIIAYFLKSRSIYIDQLYYLVDKLFLIPFLCLFFWKTERNGYILWKYLNKYLSWFGKYSLEIYVLHILLMSFFQKIGITSEVIPWHYFLGVPLSLILCVPVHRGIKRTSDQIIKYINHSFAWMQ